MGGAHLRRGGVAAHHALGVPGTPQADAILKLVGEEFGGDGIPVRPLPVAADSNPDGTMRWVGVDVILGDLAEPGADAGGRFELRSETLCTRLLFDGTR